MGLYRLTIDARQDLIDIRHFTLKQWGKKQSEHYIQGLIKIFELIAKMPAMGKMYEEKLYKETRYFQYKSHTVYYTLSKRKIILLAALHQSRLPLRHLESVLRTYACL
jgi:toxin ParE1/3/4